MALTPQYDSWRVVRKIGSGSFGTVYEIERKDFGHVYKAALKVISVPQSEEEIEAVRSSGMTGESVTQYYRSVAAEIVKEFEIMSRLKGNTNIVSYEDHQVRPREDGIGWDIMIRMELLTPLNKYISDHEFSRRDVIRLGIDLCQALERCQKFNIIHRDIKPGNIFVSDQGDFKLGDFGIARTAERTMAGMSKKGTYSYIAPEVYRGQPYGYSVDIYSLGLVMDRLLNRTRMPFMPPYPQPIRFQDQEQALVRRMSGRPLPMPCQDDTRLAEIVLKACSYDPEHRYSSPSMMRRDLQAILYAEGEMRAVTGADIKLSVPAQEPTLSGDPVWNGAPPVPPEPGRVPGRERDGTVLLNPHGPRAVPEQATVGGTVPLPPERYDDPLPDEESVYRPYTLPEEPKGKSRVLPVVLGIVAAAALAVGLGVWLAGHVGPGGADRQSPIQQLTETAEQGDAEAQYKLGVCYEKGSHTEQDYEEAVMWYRKAAEQGNVDAQLHLGRCYYSGRGAGKNYELAAKWFRAAAEQGNADAQRDLGICYDSGNGVPQSYQEAVGWYRKSAEQGNAGAQFCLGACYEAGKGVPQNREEAKNWYRLSAEQGDAEAQKRLEALG